MIELIMHHAGNLLILFLVIVGICAIGRSRGRDIALGFLWWMVKSREKTMNTNMNDTANDECENIATFLRPKIELTNLQIRYIKACLRVAYSTGAIEGIESVVKTGDKNETSKTGK